MEKDELYATANAIRTLCTTIMKMARQELEQRLDSAGVGISAGQYLVLRILHGHEHTLAELSRRMMLDPSTLVPVIDALEGRGLVTRGRDPKDRRRTPLVLTAEGAELLALGSQLTENSILVKSLRMLGEEKSQQLISLLNQFVLYLATDEDEAATFPPQQHSAVVEFTAAPSQT